MNSLVKYLSEGKHPVEIILRTERSAETLKNWLERNFVNVRFTDTRGGTELGFALNQEKTDLSQANLVEGTGRVRLVGSLILDYVKVQCVAEIDLQTLNGKGYLETFPEESPS